MTLSCEISDDENLDGPYYVHLGAAQSVPAVRQLIEERYVSTIMYTIFYVQ